MDGAPAVPAMASIGSMSMQHHMSRPTLGFPLGTALLLIVMFCLSGIFSCCYHWDKLRSLRRGHTINSQNNSLPVTIATNNSESPSIHGQGDGQGDSIPSPPSKVTSKHQDYKQDKDESLPVIMAGDAFPTFMACPRPRHFRSLV